MNRADEKPMSKACMCVVDKLLLVIDNWQEIVVPRHVKFIDAYLRSNKDLNLAGSEFHFTKRDMEFIFWRIQQTLQEEYNRRVQDGTIKKYTYVYKVASIPRKKVIHNESNMSSNRSVLNVIEFKKKSN